MSKLGTENSTITLNTTLIYQLKSAELRKICSSTRYKNLFNGYTKYRKIGDLRVFMISRINSLNQSEDQTEETQGMGIRGAPIQELEMGEDIINTVAELIPIVDYGPNIVVRQYNDTVFKNIYHLADLHISKHNLIDICTNISGLLMEDTENSIVVIVGDIFQHYEPTIESIMSFYNLIVLISEQMPILLVPGNHDIRNPKCNQNTILKLFSQLINNVYYTDKCQNIIFGNLIFGHIPFWNHKELINADINHLVDNILPRTTNRQTQHIALYHDSIIGSYQTETLMASYGVNISVFDPFNIVMLGHHHKYQLFNNTDILKVAYCGSLTQLTFSDNPTKGFIKWSLVERNRQYEPQFIPVLSMNLFITIENDIINYDPRNYGYVSNLNVRYILGHNQSINEGIIGKLRENYTIQKIKRVGTGLYNTLCIENTQNISTENQQENIIDSVVLETFLHNIDQIYCVPIRNLHKEYVMKVTTNTENINTEEHENELFDSINASQHNWTIKELAFKNMFSYGGNKVYTILFDEGTNIVSITGSNGLGKSSIMHILIYTIFGSSGKSITNNDVLNNKSNVFECSLKFTIGDNEYKLIRHGKYFRSKLVCNAKLYLNNRMISEHKKYIDKCITDLFGKYTGFINSNVLTNNFDTKITTKQGTQLRNLFIEIFQLDKYRTISDLIRTSVIKMENEASEIKGSISSYDILVSDLDTYRNLYNEKQNELEVLIIKEREINCFIQEHTDLVNRILEESVFDTVDTTKLVHLFKILISQLNVNINDIPTEINSIDIDELHNSLVQYENKIQTYTEELSNYNTQCNLIVQKLSDTEELINNIRTVDVADSFINKLMNNEIIKCYAIHLLTKVETMKSKLEINKFKVNIINLLNEHIANNDFYIDEETKTLINEYFIEDIDNISYFIKTFNTLSTQNIRNVETVGSEIALTEHLMNETAKQIECSGRLQTKMTNLTERLNEYDNQELYENQFNLIKRNVMKRMSYIEHNMLNLIYTKRKQFIDFINENGLQLNERSPRNEENSDAISPFELVDKYKKYSNSIQGLEEKIREQELYNSTHHKSLRMLYDKYFVSITNLQELCEHVIIDDETIEYKYKPLYNVYRGVLGFINEFTRDIINIDKISSDEQENMIDIMTERMTRLINKRELVISKMLYYYDIFVEDEKQIDKLIRLTRLKLSNFISTLNTVNELDMVFKERVTKFINNTEFVFISVSTNSESINLSKNIVNLYTIALTRLTNDLTKFKEAWNATKENVKELRNEYEYTKKVYEDYPSLSRLKRILKEHRNKHKLLTNEYSEINLRKMLVTELGKSLNDLRVNINAESDILHGRIGSISTNNYISDIIVRLSRKYRIYNTEIQTFTDLYGSFVENIDHAEDDRRYTQKMFEDTFEKICCDVLEDYHNYNTEYQKLTRELEKYKVLASDYAGKIKRLELDIHNFTGKAVRKRLKYYSVKMYRLYLEITNIRGWTDIFDNSINTEEVHENFDINLYNQFEDIANEVLESDKMRTEKLVTHNSVINEKRIVLEENNVVQNKCRHMCDSFIEKINQKEKQINELTLLNERYSQLIEQINIREIYRKIIDNKTFTGQILNDKVQRLVDSANFLLTKLDSGLKIIIDTDFNIAFAKGGNRFGINLASGFETFIINFVLKLSLHYYSCNVIGNIFIIDEGLDCIDDTNLTHFQDMLQNEIMSDKVIIIITHSEQYLNVSDLILRVQYQDSQNGSQLALSNSFF